MSVGSGQFLSMEVTIECIIGEDYGLYNVATISAVVFGENRCFSHFVWEELDGA